MCHNFDPVAGLNCCHPNNPFTNRKRICCDCQGRCCAYYDGTRRDCFWPEFTHPQWLCCRILYGCDPLPCPCAEIPLNDEDEAGGEQLRRHRRGCGCNR